MKNLLVFKTISGNIITCFFYDSTTSSSKCFFMSQFEKLTKHTTYNTIPVQVSRGGAVW